MLVRLLVMAAFGLATIAPAAADAQTRTRRSAPRTQYMSPPPSIAVQSRAQFERGLMRSEGGPLFEAIIRNFPDEASDYFDNLYSAYLSTVRAPADGQVRAFGRVHHAFQVSLLQHLRLAPDEHLLRVIQARRATFQALQRTDVATCGRVTASGNMSLAVSAEFKRLNGQAQIALVDAAGAGRRTPVAARAPTNAEDRRLTTATFSQIDPTGDLLPLALGEMEVSAAAPERQCRYAIGLLSLVLALPREQGVKMALTILEQSVGTGATGR